MHQRFIIDSDYEFKPRKQTRLRTLLPLPEDFRVSLVMNSFNQSRFIRYTLDSVMEQECPNLEIVICDGKSTDGTLDILQEYVEKDSRIRLLVEEDSSPIEALHKGYRLATGHVIGLQTTSDVFLPGAFKQAVEEFKADPTLFAVGGRCAEAELDGTMKFYDWEPGAKGREYLTVDDILGFLRMPSMHSSFFRRELLFAYGGFDERFNTCHTILFLHFLLEGMRMGGRVLAVPETWGVFRRHENSNCRLIQEHSLDYHVERYWAMRHAAEMFSDFLTEDQVKKMLSEQKKVLAQCRKQG